MKHFILFLLSMLTIEVFIRFNLLRISKYIFKMIKKVTNVIFNNKVSDQWKEKSIPIYASRIIISSLKIILIFLFVFFAFYIADFFLKHFLFFVISPMGMFESMIFVFGYLYIRSLISNE